MNNIVSKIKHHFENKIFCRIIRDFKSLNGFIVAYSDDFIVIQETEEFNILGFIIVPILTIKEIRYNNSDRYYHKILIWEKLTDQVGLNHNINLKNWQTIFKSIKKCGFNVIIENENHDDETFDIGPIIKVNKNSVCINYFDSKGFLNQEETKIKWSQITLVRFDDRYINVFSKYLRKRKN